MIIDPRSIEVAATVKSGEGPAAVKASERTKLTRHCELALVVGAARSGTTLTRLLLDGHPEIASPAEAGLPGLMSHMAQVWATVHADEMAIETADDPGATNPTRDTAAKWEESPAKQHDAPPEGEAFADLPMVARDWILSTTQVPMRSYCERGHKRIYCDKSLDSVHHLALVHRLIPTVKSILVFRHVMDTIASGIEASPWGFSAYGYAPYVHASPGNSVAALASYWLDHVGRALNWEVEHPDTCHRVRYEDLVLHPAETIAGIQRFLGVEVDLSVLESAFAREPARGPGDYKVVYTDRVHAFSIGRGKRVPVALLPPRLLEALNEKLAMLGYAPLDHGWNTAERPVDAGGDGLWAQRLATIMNGMQVAPDERMRAGTFAIVAEDHRQLRWVMEAGRETCTQGDGEVDAVLTGSAEDLVLLLTGQENVGVLLRSGRIRHVVADQDARKPSELVREVRVLLAVLRNGLAHDSRVKISGSLADGNHRPNSPPSVETRGDDLCYETSSARVHRADE